MIQRFLNSQSKSISSASIILAVSYFASALLGLFRDRLLAGTFGAGNELDVYYAAFTVPDFIALILIFGAISAAIIPIFSSYLVKSEKEAWEYASVVMNVFLGFLMVVCFAMMFFAPFFVSLVSPGFSGEKRELAIMLMRIMFLSPIILGASNIISGVLQVYHRFLATALSPIMYNLGIIIGIFFFLPKFGLQGLAWGVVLGGILHLLVQIPAFIFSGFKYRLNFNLRHPGVFRTFKLMLPRSLGLGASQLNTIAITSIASTLVAGSIAIFNLANNLSAILINAVAVSVSTAVFPSMSMNFIKDETEEFLKKFSGAFRQTIFLIIPISLLILFLRAQIVRVILGAGKFDWVDTRLTTACLGILALSLFAQGLIFILSKTFYASHNTKIPAMVSFFAVAVNIFLSLLFVWMIKSFEWFYVFIQMLLKLEGVKNIEIIGLASAFSIAVILQCFLLLYLLYKKFFTRRSLGVGGPLHLKEFLDSLQKIIIASVVMVFAVLITRQILGMVLNLQLFWSVFFQLAISGIVGALVYAFVTYKLKSEESKLILGSILSRFDKK